MIPPPPPPNELLPLDVQRWGVLVLGILAVAIYLAAVLPRLFTFSMEDLLVRFGFLWLMLAMIYGTGETLGLWSWGPALRLLIIAIGLLYIIVAEGIIAAKVWIPRVRAWWRRR